MRETIQDTELAQEATIKFTGGTSIMNSTRMEDRSDYIFITGTKPGITDRNTQTIIRRHVMRDIGKARRSTKHHRGRKPLQYELVLRSGDTQVPTTWKAASTSVLASYNLKMQVPLPHSTKPLLVAALAGTTLPSPEEDRVATLTLARDSENHQASLSYAEAEGPVSRFGAGRMDPFVKYPVNINARTRALVDHSESKSPI